MSSGIQAGAPFSVPHTPITGAVSKATTTNPKDLIGVTKVSLTKLPAIAVAHGAMAMMDGATKYGPYNWRDKEVVAGIYIDAAKRHLDCWFEGQEQASDSKVHHLGHAIACCSILLDAQAKGKLVDDRPKDSEDLEFLERELAKLSDIIKIKKATSDIEVPVAKLPVANLEKYPAKCFTTNNPERIYQTVSGTVDRLNDGVTGKDATGPEVEKFIGYINSYTPVRYLKGVDD